MESAYGGEASRAGWTTEADLLDVPRTDAEAVAEILADAESRPVPTRDIRRIQLPRRALARQVPAQE